MVQKEILNQQEAHWEKKFTNKSDMFGTEPSAPAQNAVEVFKRDGAGRILELGGGQGRDTLFFAENGLTVDVLDYSPEGVKAISQKANAHGYSQSIIAQCHDVRELLPFEDNFFDGCFSHMLFCMAFTTTELKSLSEELWRVLKPGGICIYTVRHIEDADYQEGIHRGEDLWESSGFIVHFFSREKVKQLAKGFGILEIEKFEEGNLPRKLFRVVLQKQ